MNSFDQDDRFPVIDQSENASRHFHFISDDDRRFQMKINEVFKTTIYRCIIWKRILRQGDRPPYWNAEIWVYIFRRRDIQAYVSRWRDISLCSEMARNEQIRSGSGIRACRRVHLATVRPRPPSGHRPGRRQARHARILQIGLNLTQP